MIDHIQQLLSVLLDSSAAIIGIKDLNGVYLFANPEFRRLLGSAGREITGRSDRDLFPPEVAEVFQRTDAEVIRSGEHMTTEEQISIGGELRSFLSVHFPVRLEDGQVVATAIIAMDITDRKQIEHKMISALKAAEQVNAELKGMVRELEWLASIDRLTGAWNRRRFEEAARSEMNRMDRYRHPVSLIMLDLDNFKQVNDRFGHQVGDAVLAGAADLIRRHYRQADSLTRWGGEEFVVLTPSTPLSDAVMLAERLRGQMESHLFPDVGAVTASFGVAEYQSGETYDDWVRRADQALYAAKRAGRNCVEVDPATEFGQTPAEHAEGRFVQLVWRSSYCCGHPTIDEEHQTLFRHADELLAAVLSARPPDEIADLMQGLMADISGHFEDEEQILRGIGYPYIEEHAAIHAGLMREARSLVDAFAGGTLPVGSLFQFVAYDVIALHILGADRQYFPYLEASYLEAPNLQEGPG